VADIEKISSSEYVIDGTLSRFTRMPVWEYPLKAGHAVASIAYRKSLLALPRQG
jgi:hypothetical protein